MNFLAHIYLSGTDDTDLMLGNFMADSVKGRKQFDTYSPAIQRGIILHRAIDKFTDKHAIVKQGIARLRPHQGRYSSVLLDIYYDYLLVNNWTIYSDTPLRTFTQSTYRKLLENQAVMPPKLQKSLPKMISGNWLENYGTEKGLTYTFQRVSERVRFESNIATAFQDFQQYEAIYTEEFNVFFPMLIDFAATERAKLIEE